MFAVPAPTFVVRQRRSAAPRRASDRAVRRAARVGWVTVAVATGLLVARLVTMSGPLAAEDLTRPLLAIGLFLAWAMQLSLLSRSRDRLQR